MADELGIGLAIAIDGAGVFPEMKGEPIGRVIKMARLHQGTSSGGAAVAVQIKLPDGRLVYGETTLRLLLMATRAFRAAEEKDGVTYEE